MHNYKKILVFILALTLTMGLNVNFVSAAALPNEINQVESTINLIKDPKVKDQILDMINIEYLEFEIFENSISENDIDNLNKELLTNNIEELSKLSAEQLDKQIRKTINELIVRQDKSSNILILPSSYEFLEKYGFAKEVSQLKLKEQKVTIFSSRKETINTYAANSTYDNAYVGKITNLAGSLTAYAVLEPTWKTNSSNEIYYWNPKFYGSYYTTFYKLSDYGIDEQYTSNHANTLYIKATNKLEKVVATPTGTPQFSKIIIKGYYYANGDCSVTSEVTGAYN